MNLKGKKQKGTLVFPVRRGKVLLGQKTRQIGVGLWNGWGGGIEKGETTRDAAVRELRQESGLITSPDELVYCGKVTFHNTRNGRKFDVEVHMFLVYEWKGSVLTNDEMKNPAWWPVRGLPPWEEFMPSDKDWLSFVLAGKIISGQTWQEWVLREDGSERVVLAKESQIVCVG